MRQRLTDADRICVEMFATNLEVSIVNTSLVSIADGLGGFSKVGWVVTADLLTFVGTRVIFQNNER